ncbi:MAG TPA: hypothetical protein RMH99_28595, partial [Sandaracinaceae bacterium LLY-WYZ-13_1]|nr:hypothetical protein [Sandaracinaceae bacterium LLY-WYZ-13_1]
PTGADPLAGVPGRPPDRRERQALAQLQRVAERVRELTFERPVPFRIQSRDVITQFVRDQMDAEELERARIFYVALGLLDPDLDVQDLLIRVLGEQIVGYYDPEQGLMVIRDDVAAQLSRRVGHFDRELGEAEMVIVHELVHALQDQRLDLGAHYEEERTIDGDNAFAALVEGDATLAMIGHMAARAGQPLSNLTRNAALLRMLIRSQPQTIQGQEIENAPPIVRLPLVSRYLDGMVFCATLHGGNGWPGVDSAHRTPPTSTEQVLHPERYLADEQPEEVTLPALPALTEAGLTPHEEDRLGELEMGIYFGLGRDGAERDESAAEGWGGDRLRVYRDGEGGTAVVWFTTWDDEGEATEAERAARAVLEQVALDDRARHRVERRGRAVLIVRGLDPSLHDPVRDAFARGVGAPSAAASAPAPAHP